MKIELFSDLNQLPKSDLLVFPFWEKGESASDLGRFKSGIEPILKSGDFKARNGETFLCYVEGLRIALLGLGKKSDVNSESLRRAYSAAVRLAQLKNIKSAQFVCIEGNHTQAIFEGIFLSNYAYNKWKSDSFHEVCVPLLETIGLIGTEAVRHEALFRELQVIVSSVHWVRDLVNGNADDKLDFVLHEIKSIFSGKKVRVEIFDKQKLEELQMGLILAVSRGAPTEPCLIQVSYEGNPGSPEHVVLVGKGVTYDTGGFSIKPTEGMLTMKCDMSGAAAVLGTVRAAAELGLKINVTALAPMAENSIDGKSYKLGDVYRSYSGRTVEINNTDAEGRLILADALAFAVKNLGPSCIVDVATLTGAAIIALGDDISALFSDDQKLCDQLLSSAATTGEALWRLPLVADYKDAYKSEIADTVNSGGREGGAIKAALFLQPFVGVVPWAHIDLAGPAYLNKPKHYNTSKATGYGVRLLLDFLRQRAGHR